ncbi:MAG: CHAT domain-containing protein [Cyanobacteria bacterium J06656_5]
MLLLPAAAHAQSITAADSSTTIVQQTDSLFQIDGGSLSGDSTTLFHSFERFGLLTRESAQFGNPATVETIIGRVNGDASVIDGLLAVDGDANLYLLNPAGILFGENAELNLGGSFSASTATGLVFGNELFDGFGNNDLTSFTGAPTGYVFGAEQTGTVVNTGDLAVNSGETLTLLGGQVINTGQLSAPGGEILVMAVPGENLVRLSPSGSLLGLELETLPEEFARAASAFTVSTVPALLTGAKDLGMATDITVNSDGTVSLSGSSLQIPVDGGTAIVSGQLEADGGGNIGVLGDQVALVGASVDASGNTGGGTVLIGGDELGNGTVPNAIATVIDQTSVVRADARDVGDGGKIVAWGTNLLRSAGQLVARGGANGGDGGFVETSSLGGLDVAIAPDISAVNGLGGLWLLDPANITIVAGEANDNITTTAAADTNIFDTSGTSELEALLGVELIRAALSDGINVEVRITGEGPGEGNITLATPLDYNATDGTLSLVAEGDIRILDDIFDSSDEDSSSSVNSITLGLANSIDLSFIANGQITIEGNVTTQGGQLSLISNQAGINAGALDTQGEFLPGETTIQAADDIVADVLLTSGGGILVESQQGSIELVEQPNEDAGPSISSLGGDVTLRALQGSVAVSELITTSISDTGADPSGNVTIESLDSISVDQIVTDAVESDSGQVSLRSQGDILFGAISTLSDTGAGGDVVVESSTGNVRGLDVISFFPATGVSEFEESSATIVTDGFKADGTITITHGGQAPFDIGDASVNGTAGSLTTGETTLADGNPNEPFLGSFDAGDIQIVVADSPPSEQPPSEQPPSEEISDIDQCITDCQTDVNLRHDGSNPGDRDNTLLAPEVLIKRFEEKLTTDVADYLKPGLAEGEQLPTYNGSPNQDITAQSLNTADLPTAQANLLRVQDQTGKRPALIYAVFGASDIASGSDDVLQTPMPSDSLELLLITAEGEPQYIRLGATRGEVLRLAQRFRRQVATPSRVNSRTYLQPAQALYQVLIAPLQAELEAQNIDTISFIADTGLRSIPLAALHDGEKFVIENYNIGLMPSLSLTDLTYRELSNVGALVAGTSAFANQVSLPGVPVELDAIASKWRSTVLQGKAFSLDTLKDERQQSPHGIIHLATHGEFNVGDLSKSYLYLHNERLRLDQLRSIGLNQPSVELLTLSACQTALGNRSAELGFAGFAVLAGAKTSVASLWSVSDEASAGLMIEFYRQLQDNQPTIKAEALREAQLAMLRGDIFVEDDRLQGLAASRQLPDELTIEGQEDFKHPYYWAAFSLVGSPW